MKNYIKTTKTPVKVILEDNNLYEYLSIITPKIKQFIHTTKSNISNKLRIFFFNICNIKFC